MNGPEHYREAERLLKVVSHDDWEATYACAQVHATLALAAATAELVGDELVATPEWRKAFYDGAS